MAVNKGRLLNSQFRARAGDVDLEFMNADMTGKIRVRKDMLDQSCKPSEDIYGTLMRPC
jgi:hypothetical protein